jgi:hypothetical protein
VTPYFSFVTFVLTPVNAVQQKEARLIAGLHLEILSQI